MPFRIRGLAAQPFQQLFGLSDAELAARGVQRVVVDAPTGYPDRVELRDLSPGEYALLLNYVHQPADNAYRASHAIFVREGATQAFDRVDDVPAVFRTRMLSLRAYDANDLMVDADLVDGTQVEYLIGRMLARNDVAYIHAHYAKRGCYAARIDPA